MPFVSTGDHPTVAMLSGIERTVVASGEGAMIVRFELDKGAVLPAHSHPHEQMGFILAGILDLTIGAETRSLRAGEAYIAPPNTVHSAVATERSIVIDVFAPPRADYL